MAEATLMYVVWAVVLGAVSAVSLPLGSLVGLKIRFKERYIAILAAFGAGASRAGGAVCIASDSDVMTAASASQAVRAVSVGAPASHRANGEPARCRPHPRGRLSHLHRQLQ